MNAYDTDQTSSIPGSKGRVPSPDRGAQFRPPAIKRKRQFDPFERLEQEWPTIYVNKRQCFSK